jgi:hypothetical protein
MGLLMAVKFIRLKEIGVHVRGVRVTMDFDYWYCRYPSALVAPLSYSALKLGFRAGME